MSQVPMPARPSGGTGRANPSVSTLDALVAELDVSLDELLFGDRRGSLAASPARPDAALADGPGPVR